MFKNILTVCTGNICRSPVAEAALRAALPEANLSSAGLHALVGRDIDKGSAEAAVAHNIPLLPHAARQFDDTLGRDADLILVMETHHRQEIAQRWPHFMGKTFLLGHFNAAREVPDPYRQGRGMHHHAVSIILECCPSWVQQLEKVKTPT